MISCLPEEDNLSYSSKPVLHVDYPNPTADKPQSKLWYMHNYWWAILPKSSGPSLWQRTNDGWIEHNEVSNSLAGLPGRADVWSDLNQITAIGVEDNSLTVFRLISNVNSKTTDWESDILSKLVPPDSCDLIETATIVRDDRGVFYVAAVANTRVCVWWSQKDNDRNWDGPIILANGIDKDDICVISPLEGGVGVIWSDQVNEEVALRIHNSLDAEVKWGEKIIIQKGNKTSDDHLNTSLADDGTLWLATKNSVDMVGKPQFVLRIRLPNGKWINKPYVNLDSTNFPTRPIIIASSHNSTVMTVYSDSDRSKPFPYASKIIFSIIDTNQSSLMHNPKVVISPDTLHNSFINNVTGPRHPFAKEASWIVLASDQHGNVYEADLRQYINK